MEERNALGAVRWEETEHLEVDTTLLFRNCHTGRNVSDPYRDEL